jgi:cytochrome c oxidase subunit 2
MQMPHLASFVLATVLSTSLAPVQEAHHVVNITARRYSFTPARLEVHHGDVVRITLETEDIPHSLTIDALRICKRVTPGRSVTFEFRVDVRGTLTFYCSLTDEPGGREMKGDLVVR